MTITIKQAIFLCVITLSSMLYSQTDQGIYFSRRSEDKLWGIYFYSFKNKSTTPVIVDKTHEYGTPASSPNGQYLAFTTNKQGRYDLVYSPLNSNKAWTFVSKEANNSHPTWASDSKRLAYVSTRNQKTEIFVYNLETKEEFSITSNFATAGQPDWHPTEDKIVFCGTKNTNAYDGRVDLFTYDLKQKTYQQITPSDDTIKESHPVWDHDGNGILFDKANISYENGYPVVQDSVIAHYKKGNTTIIAQGNKFYSNPEALPQSNKIIFLRHEPGFRSSIVSYENQRYITELTFGYTDRTPRFGYRNKNQSN